MNAMPESSVSNNDFLKKISEVIEENISNEKFGVSELAGKMGMSRSNLLRKIRKLTNLSASQYISQERLKSAMELLKSGSYNISEVSYEVGFSSTSYFTKCFREYYGYPPGEVGKHSEKDGEDAGGQKQQVPPGKRKRVTLLVSILALTAIIIMLFSIVEPLSSKKNKLKNSIAVLPFRNDSNDSSNVYLINGLMETLLNDLQQIEDLRVISRTSVEKYRHNTLTIPEIAEELNVNFIIEGSGQKIGDQILLNIQLIEASRDKHLWSEQYRRESKDIFELQREIANAIVDEIEVIITPEEEERMQDAPTDNPIAYDYFFKGLDVFHSGTAEGLLESILYFEKAIEYDREFARAYADIAIAYAMLDLYQVKKSHLEEISFNAAKALQFDSKLSQSLVANALLHINIGEHEKAVPYLEKALKYNPNSAMVINLLSDFYANYMPDTEKYLEYALKGINIDLAAHDSTETSFIYLHVSNAFIQSGFVDEAMLYIDKALEYDRNNSYAAYVRAFILYARDGNLEKTNDILLKVLNGDMTRFDILQEIGKIYYYMRDYENALIYYRKFLDIREAQNLEVYRFENAKIGVVLDKMGLKEEAEQLFDEYLIYAENSDAVYRHVSLAMYYSYTGDSDSAIEHLKMFSQQEKYHYWTILFLEIDPLVDPIIQHPEFEKIFGQIKSNFWERHNKLSASLKNDGLI
jgi:TolB-like protein/AraC-like DNA-binding protein/Tfp pilus assembly protein PilF